MAHLPQSGRAGHLFSGARIARRAEHWTNLMAYLAPQVAGRLLDAKFSVSLDIVSAEWSSCGNCGAGGAAE